MWDSFIAVSMFFMIGWITWVIFSSVRRYKIARFQADVQARLLHQLDSSQSLLAYVETPAGRQFVKDLSTERAERNGPYQRILSSTQAGIILTIFGAALLVLRSRVNGGEEPLTVFGTLAIALGLGFCVAAAASYFLSRSFGLFDRETR